MRVRAQDVNGDYTFGQGSQNFLVDSPECVAQLVITGLRLFQGEWYLDTSAGMPWMNKVIGADTQSIYDSAIQTQILSTAGVTGIENYSSSLDAEKRQLTVSFTVETQFGPIEVTTSLPYIEFLSGYGVGGYSWNGYGQ